MSETQLPQLVLEVAGQVVSTNLDAFKVCFYQQASF